MPETESTTRTLTAEIHYVIKPDADEANQWDSWDDAPEDIQRAMDIRHQFGDYENGADDITADDLADLYNQVGTDELTISEDADPASALETVWAGWNNGSRQESRAFRRAGVRSMCVGDIVIIRNSDGDRVGAWMADSIGFSELTNLESEDN